MFNIGANNKKKVSSSKQLQRFFTFLLIRATLVASGMKPIDLCLNILIWLVYAFVLKSDC